MKKPTNLFQDKSIQNSLYILLFFLFPLFSLGQNKKNADQQSILWTRYYNQLAIDNQWSIHTEFDNRVFLKPIAENLFVFRIQGRYQWNSNIETGAGFAYFSVFTQDPLKDFDFEIPEYRFQQDITYKLNFKKFTLNQRLQVEERFINNASQRELLDGTTFSWRFRYRLQLEYELMKKADYHLKAVMYDEIMVNAGKSIVYNTFDQNRIYAALQYGINKNIAVELGYLKSFQQRPSGVDYFDRDILRLSIFHKIHI